MKNANPHVKAQNQKVSNMLTLGFIKVEPENPVCGRGSLFGIYSPLVHHFV
jgi:hypothetical protein